MVCFDRVMNLTEHGCELADPSDHVRVSFDSYVPKRPQHNWCHSQLPGDEAAFAPASASAALTAVPKFTISDKEYYIELRLGFRSFAVFGVQVCCDVNGLDAVFAVEGGAVISLLVLLLLLYLLLLRWLQMLWPWLRFVVVVVTDSAVLTENVVVVAAVAAAAVTVTVTALVITIVVAAVVVLAPGDTPEAGTTGRTIG